MILKFYSFSMEDTCEKSKSKFGSRRVVDKCVSFMKIFESLKEQKEFGGKKNGRKEN